MTSVIESLERAQLRRVPDFQAGDRVRVHFQVIEGTRRRTQVFEGVVIKRQGHGARETFTVRKQSFGVGVERTFPVHSPKIEKIDVAARGDVRRAKLYYLRDRVGKAARVRERRYVGTGEDRAPLPRLPAVARRGARAQAAEQTEADDAEGVVAEETVEEAVEAQAEAGRGRGRRGGRDRGSCARVGGDRGARPRPAQRRRTRSPTSPRQPEKPTPSRERAGPR